MVQALARGRIVVDGLSFAYGSQKIFDNLTFTLECSGAPLVGGLGGHVVAIMGKSGAGKSTLLRLLAGLETKYRGSLQVEGGERGIGYLPQTPVLFDHLSAEANARLLGQVGASRAAFDSTLYDELVRRLGLEGALRTPTKNLSGGERQRVALLRALSVRPSLLLLDEPCNALDQPVKQEFLSLLRHMVDDFGILCVYVTHHPDEAQMIADSILFLASRGENASPIGLNEYRAFVESPPTLESARFLGSPALNTLRVSYSHGLVQVAESSIGVCEGVESLPNGVYELVFPASTVVWSSGVGVIVRPLGRSSSHWFCSPIEVPQGVIVGPHSAEAPQQFTVAGRGFLFSPENGEFLATCIIASP